VVPLKLMRRHISVTGQLAARARARVEDLLPGRRRRARSGLTPNVEDHSRKEGYLHAGGGVLGDHPVIVCRSHRPDLGKESRLHDE
jgi:hypothetical protein